MIILRHCLQEPQTYHFDLSAKRDLMGIAKSIKPGQPAQSAQADQGRNFSLLADFQGIKR